jgi:predicted DNA-binding transcriptional regulator YafY
MDTTRRGRQMYRLMCELNILRRCDRNGITAAELTRLLWDAMGLRPDEKFSIRTVRRDLKLLSDTFGWIEKRGERFLPGAALLDGLQIGTTYEEMLSVWLARRLLDEHQGTPVLSGLETLYRKYQPLLPRDALRLFTAMQSAFLFKGTPPSGRPAPQIVQQLYAAIQDAQRVLLRYQSIHWDEPRESLYDPLAIVYYQDLPYLIAHSRYREARRRQTAVTLKVSRISKVTFTGEHFSRPRPESLMERIGRVIGVFVGRQPQTYRIRLTQFAARLIREEPWHQSQRIRRLRDGSYELRLTLDNDIELLPRVLSLGPDAEAIAPPEFREKARQAVEEMAKKYASSKEARQQGTDKPADITSVTAGPEP